MMGLYAVLAAAGIVFGLYLVKAANEYRAPARGLYSQRVEEMWMIYDMQCQDCKHPFSAHDDFTKRCLFGPRSWRPPTLYTLP